MRILIAGGGGREHAVSWALAQNPRVHKIYCAPGNAGIAALAECVPISGTNLDAMTAFALQNSVDFCAVVSDDPQAAGLADAMETVGIRTFGCSKAAARLESSKVFSKALMEKYGIPTAKSRSFSDCEDALAFLQTHSLPIVVKADGLALGKGVVIAETLGEAEDAVRSMMLGGRFAEAGKHVVIEEFMEGREVTVMAFTDGKTLVTMPPCRDHKRIGNGDTGPNTGGMGVICPPPDYTPDIHETALKTIFEPTLAAMRTEGCPFKGVIYFGLMLTADGPKVVEYNARFGDPEAQAVLPLLETDLLDIMEAVADGRLDTLDIRFKNAASAIVIAASRGYPGQSDTGHPITGLDAPEEDIHIFHAGTKADGLGGFTNAGGRVIGLCAVRPDLKQALAHIYRNMGKVHFEGMQFRTDIGKRDIE